MRALSILSTSQFGFRNSHRSRIEVWADRSEGWILQYQWMRRPFASAVYLTGCFRRLALHHDAFRNWKGRVPPYFHHYRRRFFPATSLLAMRSVSSPDGQQRSSNQFALHASKNLGNPLSPLTEYIEALSLISTSLVPPYVHEHITKITVFTR